MSQTRPTPPSPPDNSDRLAHREVAIEPDIPIVDPHHHLWDSPAHWMATHYPIETMMQDVHGGHHVVQTVYLECSSHYRTDGPEELRPVGETEWVAAIEAPRGMLAGIVPFADVRLGAGVNRVLDAHAEAAGGRLVGVRYTTAHDDHPDVVSTSREAPPGTLLAEEFQEGVRRLGARGLVFDSWAYFHQLGEVLALAQAAPETKIVVDHLGGPAGTGPYAHDREGMLSSWRSGILALARQENLVLKLGGIGFAPYLDPAIVPQLDSSEKIAEYWAPEILFCIEAFGADRCMFESNFPVDSYLCDYVTLWNSFKRITEALSPDERARLFAGTARETYGLPAVE